MTLNSTGVSELLFSTTVWYTDSPGLHGWKSTLFVFILTIGINGWLPGAKLCPHRRKFNTIGGSISSFVKSTYLDFFMLPSSVLFVFVAFDESLASVASCLTLNWLPFSRWMKHWAIWKK